MEPRENLGGNYRWAMLGMAVLVVFAALGLSRFSYTSILPFMQKGLDLSNSQAGGLATANLAGYMTMAVVGGALASYLGPRHVISAGLLLASLGMVITGLAASYPLALVGRLISGIGAASASVPAHTMLSLWFSSRHRGLAAGVAATGCSLGLVLAGPLVPFLMGRWGPEGWRWTWLVLAAVVLALALAALAVLRNRPGGRPGDQSRGQPRKWSEEGPGASPDVRPGTLSKERLGTFSRERLGTPSGESSHIGKEKRLLWRHLYLSKRVWNLGGLYFLFGFAYMAYLTFFTKRLMADGGYTAQTAGTMFMTLGWASLVCGVLWGWVADKLGRERTMTLILLIQSTSYALFALSTQPGAALASAVLFGITAWGIPAIMAALCSDLAGPVIAPAVYGFLTVFHGLGQATGPYAAGKLADLLPTFRASYFLAAAVAFLGALGMAGYRRSLAASPAAIGRGRRPASETLLPPA